MLFAYNKQYLFLVCLNNFIVFILEVCVFHIIVLNVVFTCTAIYTLTVHVMNGIRLHVQVEVYTLKWRVLVPHMHHRTTYSMQYY